MPAADCPNGQCDWNTTTPDTWPAIVDRWDWTVVPGTKTREKTGPCPRCDHTMWVTAGPGVADAVGRVLVRAYCNCDQVDLHPKRPKDEDAGCGQGAVINGPPA
jgi:hypothetical protein